MKRFIHSRRRMVLGFCLDALTVFLTLSAVLVALQSIGRWS
jgi:hypothetical protein